LDALFQSLVDEFHLVFQGFQRLADEFLTRLGRNQRVV
jgi:hypothetical protein